MRKNIDTAMRAQQQAPHFKKKAGVNYAALHTPCVIAACLLASTAYAQTDAKAPAADDVPQKIESVVVTGSYFGGPAVQKTTLETISADDIAKSPQPSLIMLLSQLPATQGNLNTGGSNDNGNSPVQSINLRGLGPRATLVLLNGQRQVSVSEPGGPDSFSVDINSLVPSVLIKRVDVLKDGASALYGSDAVAGVVNFVTRKDLDGVVADVGGGILSAKGRKNGHTSLGFGSHGDRTSVIGGIEVSHQDQVHVTDVFDADRIAKFGQTSAFANPGTFFVNGVAKADPLCGSSTIGGSPVAGLLVGGRCRQDLTQVRGMVAQFDRVLGYMNVNYNVSDSTTLSAEFGAAHVGMDRDNQVGLPINTTTITVPAANPGNPFGANAVANLRWGSMFLGDVAKTLTNSNTYRGKVGLEGSISKDWDYSVSIADARNESGSYNSGYASNSRLQAALNCKGGSSGTECFNPFASSYLAAPGSNLYNSPALIDWIAVARTNQSSYTLRTYDALVTGTLLALPNGMPVKLAVGAQRREEQAVNRNDAESKSTDVSFAGPATDYSVTRKVDAMFAELRIPVTSTLELDAAAREERSHPGNSTLNPKISASWKVVPGLTLAGGVGRSERAPGLLQFIGGSGLTNIAVDPITKTAQNGVALQILPSTGLSPESSVNSNLGVIWDKKSAVGDFHVSLDYFNIDFKHLITGVDATGLVLSDPTNPAIKRDPVSGQIQLITIPGYFNSNQMLLNGVDFASRYGTTLAGTKVFASFDGTWMRKYRFATANGVVSDFLGTYDTAVAPVPRLAFRFAIGMSAFGTDMTLTTNYKSKLTETTPGLKGITEEKAYKTFDFSAAHKVGEKTWLNFGILNLLNTLPPAQANSIYTATGFVYPLTGRSFSASLRTEF